MIRQPVQSSNVASVGHDPKTNELEVQFKSGRVYRYSDVNVDEAAALMSAQSIGSHLANIIKPVKAATIVMTDQVTGENANG
jgi:predicted TIM-barrel enzyme